MPDVTWNDGYTLRKLSFYVAVISGLVRDVFVVKVMGSYEINEKVSNVSKDIGLSLKEESKSVTEVMTPNILCPELFNQK